MSCCCIADLRDKEIINLCDGRKLGCVCDVEIDTCDGKVVAIVASGDQSGFCFGKNDEITIPWDKIEKIGEDIIIVNFSEYTRPGCDCRDNEKPKRKFF